MSILLLSLDALVQRMAALRWDFALTHLRAGYYVLRTCSLWVCGDECVSRVIAEKKKRGERGKMCAVTKMQYQQQQQHELWTSALYYVCVHREKILTLST